MDIFEAARTNDAVELNKSLQNTHPDVRDSRGSTPLILAAYYNNQQAAIKLLTSGADPDLQDSMGNTALMGVCFRGYYEMANILVTHGASVGAVNGNNATALTFAATFGHAKLVELLLDYGANPLIPDRFGKNPIDHAQIQENAECYEMMVARLNEIHS